MVNLSERTEFEIDLLQVNGEKFVIPLQTKE